jgi:hypothetical protein
MLKRQVYAYTISYFLVSNYTHKIFVDNPKKPVDTLSVNVFM